MNKKTIIAIVAVIALVAVLGVVLMACSAESYQKKLEKKGYSVSTYKVDKEDQDDVEWGLVATKGLLSEAVYIVKYKSLDDAKDAERDQKDLGIGTVYRTGRIVMWGSEQGVKDAK